MWFFTYVVSFRSPNGIPPTSKELNMHSENELSYFKGFCTLVDFFP